MTRPTNSTRNVRISGWVWVAAAIGCIGIVSIASATILPAFTVPKLRRGIPARDYQYHLHSQAQMVPSTSLTMMEIPPPARRPPDGLPQNQIHEIRVFQLPVAKLELNDRKISRVVFQVEENGCWTLSLRGDFHDRTEDRTTPFVDGHLKRCKFRVKVRCYGNYPVGEETTNETTGKPVLFQTGPIDFWVQSGEPFDMWTRGNCAEAKFTRNYFELIDRVEVEFSYFEAIGVTRPVATLGDGQ